LCGGRSFGRERSIHAVCNNGRKSHYEKVRFYLQKIDFVKTLLKTAGKIGKGRVGRPTRPNHSNVKHVSKVVAATALLLPCYPPHARRAVATKW
jgi:hypothetical protein